ncbi:hypothetical protein ACFQ60_38070 [Streptomyces zhihengii]
MTGTGLRHVAVVGAGAAGAFFTLELSRLRPDVTIDLHDRDGRGPGAGIVMSTEFMDGLRPRFPGVFDLPPDATGTWDRTLTRVGDEDIWSGAYGTVALGRRAFHARTRALAEAGPGCGRCAGPSVPRPGGPMWWSSPTGPGARCAAPVPRRSARPSPKAAPTSCGPRHRCASTRSSS